MPQSLSRWNQTVLFDATAAGATLSKTLFPGSYTCPLPDNFGSAPIVNSNGLTVGGVFSPPQFTNPAWNGVLLDFCAVGSASQSLVVEIGKVYGTGQLTMPLASVSLTSMVTSGTITGYNPYTGQVTNTAPGGLPTTWRLFDLTTITAKGAQTQVIQVVGGAQDNTPSQIGVVTKEGEFFYAIITSIASLTEVVCVATPY